VHTFIRTFACVTALLIGGAPLAQTTELISLPSSLGLAPLDGATLAVRVSEDGSREFIHSYATNLVQGDTNGVGDIFYRDSDGPWSRAFTGIGGVPPNGESQEDFNISGDGRWLVFVSTATNLISGDTNGSADVFLRDMSTGALRRINIGNLGVPPNGFPQYREPNITPDGAMACFVTNSNAITGGFTGTFELVSTDVATMLNRTTPGESPSRCTLSPNKLGVAFEDSNTFAPPPQIWYHEFSGAPVVFSLPPSGNANGPSTRPFLAGTGYGTLVYTSAASNLVPGDTNGSTDVFMRPLDVFITTRLSLAPNGSQLPGDSTGLAISQTADVVVFRSLLPGTVADPAPTPRLFLRDLRATPATRALATPATSGWTPENDYRMAAVTTSRAVPRVLFVSRDMGQAADRTLRIHDAYRAVPDGQAEALAEAVIQTAGGNGDSLLPRLANGQRVAFYSAARNLASRDFNASRDVFLYDPATTPRVRLVTRVGTASANGDSFDIRPPAITPDGAMIAFRTTAALVASDVNARSDIYLWRAASPTEFVLGSVGTGGLAANGDSFMPSLSNDGRYLAFASNASNLVSADTNGYSDVFVRDLQLGTTVRASVGTLAEQGVNASFGPEIADDGLSIAFCTHAANLSGATGPSEPVVVLKRLGSGAVTRITMPGSMACAFDYSADRRSIAYGDVDGGWLFPLTAGGAETPLFTQDSEPRSLSLSAGAGAQRGLALPSTGYPIIFLGGTSIAEAVRTPLSPPLADFFFESATVAPTGRSITFDNAQALVLGDSNVNVFDVFFQPTPLSLFANGLE
jgi:Tol biopolymer transport system component